MTVSENQIHKVVDACRTRLGDPGGWVSPDAYRRSLALCIIESVQAAGARFADAGLVVDRYLAYRRAHDSGPVTDGARTLLRTFEQVGSADQWAGKIGNYKRRYSESAAPLRASEIQRAAERLHALHIDSVADLIDATHDSHTASELRTAWHESCGANDDTTWLHLLLLAGIADADDTAAVEGFVRSALTGSPDPCPPAAEVLAAAADELGVSPTALEYAVLRWRCTCDEHFLPVA
ncbi:heme peroxidase [Rhodococcus spongiicola]|uniref:Heme peroxidase n=1 Tax=Rhodococcus spongiicola TaxID=2487352 RepID=A0A438B520_9NOCA|nr:heme peroxidase [Rhodococcus spongiicola]RVW06061.1 heme peroxidase [Rhodococcus spongiicola]